jgi:hypothetical protein
MVGGKKTQKEYEQPAKVYQLDALEAKVDVVIGKLDEIKNNTSGMVSQAQLDSTKDSLDRKIEEEVEKIHLEYRPMKKNISWFIKAMVLEGIAILGQFAIMAFLWISSRGN